MAALALHCCACKEGRGHCSRSTGFTDSEQGREVPTHTLGSSQPPMSGQSLRGSGSVAFSSSPSSAGEMVMLSHLNTCPNQAPQCDSSEPLYLDTMRPGGSRIITAACPNPAGHAGSSCKGLARTRPAP
jgi:hypothetical protein